MSAPARTRFYRPELDVLRFFAFFLVFNRHLLPYLPGASLPDRLSRSAREMGAYGVCVFFLLSSYLITELLMREQGTTGDVHLGGFYVRRILRIWPLYFLAILLVVLLPASTPHSTFDWHRILAFLLLSGNWSLALHGMTSILYLSPLWTISLEEQFYLLWPSIAKRWKRPGIFAVCTGAILVSYATLAYLCAFHVTRGAGIWCNSFVQFQFFAIGGLLALALHQRRFQVAGWVRLTCGLAGCFSLFLADFAFHLGQSDCPDRLATTVPAFLCLALGSTLLFLAAAHATLPAWTAPLTYLGKISYGLYIYHLFADTLVEALFRAAGVPVKGIVRVLIYLVTAAVTVLLASVSYRFFEMPFLKYKERFTFVKSRAA